LCHGFSPDGYSVFKHLIMLRVRILSAVVLLPIFVAFLLLGSWWFFVLMLVALSLAGWEFVKLMQKGNHSPWLPAVWSLIWLALLDAKLSGPSFLVPAVTLVMVVALIWSMKTFSQGQPDPSSQWALSLAGGLYLGLLGANFVSLRERDNGLAWSVMAYGGTWLADVGAYFIGRQWGRHKLVPKLSPGKTVEGSLGGLAIGTIGTAILAALCDFPVWQGLILGALIALLSPLGDLAVSMIKRQVRAKDSGTLIPGHGGVLDRIDSLLVSVSVTLFFVQWIVQ
jgi:phosphatidate cytidylyltransferase